MKMAASLLFVSLLCATGELYAAAPLFPSPLHLTRQVRDSISGKTTVVDEYGYGNRLISIRGAHTSIADYEKGVLTEIDREQATYSVTRFDIVAKASAGSAVRDIASAESSEKPVLRAGAAKRTKLGRPAEFFESQIDSAGSRRKVEVGVDRTVLVSREALEVLLGSAYPGQRRREHDVALSAAAPADTARSLSTASQATPSYALPVEEVVDYDIEGQHLEFRTSVVRVGNEQAPADLVAIPAGARLVPSRIATTAAEVEQMNRPTPAVTKGH
ncbi:MAG: hypothetical protein ACXV7D_13750 [Thermoanaerobaculia bacterium]